MAMTNVNSRRRGCFMTTRSRVDASMAMDGVFDFPSRLLTCFSHRMSLNCRDFVRLTASGIAA